MAQDQSERKTKRRPYLGLYVKLYISSLDDIKIRQMDAATRCFWMDALMLAKPHHGVLPALREMAFRLRMSEGEVRSRVMALVALDLIDEDHASGSVAWSAHAWDKWQSDGISTPRVKRHRERRKSPETQVKRQRNVSCNANETLETNFYSHSQNSTEGKSSAPRGIGLPRSETGSTDELTTDVLRRDNTSGYLGVSRHSQTGRWQAVLGYENRKYYLGLFDTPEAAHERYLDARSDPFSVRAICDDFGGEDRS